MTGIAPFLESYYAAQCYPQNLSCELSRGADLETLACELDNCSDRLFDTETQASVDIWDKSSASAGWESFCLRNAEYLNDHLLRPIWRQRADPACRFIYIHAPHSMERLRISRDMSMRLLAYHQVMPAFLEHMFSFGRRHYRESYHVSGFRSESRIGAVERLLSTPELGRSGLQLELCYTLRSVEASGDRSNPWSIRQCSIYHQSDLEYDRSVWIVVKGNELMRDLIESRLRSRSNTHEKHDPRVESYQHDLMTHVAVCKWSTKNWHMYLSTLESLIHDKTRRTLSTRLDKMSTSQFTRDSVTSPPMPRVTASDRHRQPPEFTRLPYVTEPTSLHHLAEKPSTSVPYPPLPDAPLPMPQISMQQSTFSFKDLQQVQAVEEKANDALLILKANSNVVRQLRNHYQMIADAEDCPDDIRSISKPLLKRFDRVVENIHSEFTTLLGRVEALQRLVQERKGLVYLILQYRNMEASRELAEKAQESARNMEDMTKNMALMAEQTKRETVNMRIITIVTLFFLPGTFISTLMSTPIVTFDQGNSHISDRVIGTGALQFYVAVSVPLMCLTFAAWYAFYWWEKRSTRAEALAMRMMPEP